jgi:hypothetical protein
MTDRALSISVDHAVASFGLFVLVVVARLANRGYAQQTAGTSGDVLLPARGLSGFLARRAIDGVAVIGWLADHLPGPHLQGGM